MIYNEIIQKEYLVVLEDTQDGYSTFIPQVDGCVSYGDDISEAIANTVEALTLHLSGYIEDKISIPAQNIEEAKKQFPNEMGMLIHPDKFLLSKLLKTKQKRINITINENILELCDKKAKQRGTSRSALIENALIETIG